MLGVRVPGESQLTYILSTDGHEQPGQIVMIEINGRQCDAEVIIAAEQMLEFHGDTPTGRVLGQGGEDAQGQSSMGGAALLHSLRLPEAE